MLKAEPHGHLNEILLSVEAHGGDGALPFEATFRLTPEASAELRQRLKRAETMLVNRRRLRVPR
jgi:hypothetical protein